MYGKSKRQGSPKYRGGQGVGAQRRAMGERSPAGRKPLFVSNPQLRDDIMKFAAMGTPRDVSRMCKLAERTIQDWLNAGERALSEGLEDNEYAQFRLEYKEAQAMGRRNLILGVIDIATAKQDWKGLDKMITRLDDEMQYIDRDRVAGRTETNITIGGGGAVISGAPSLSDLREFLAGRNVRELEEGQVVEGEISDE